MSALIFGITTCISLTNIFNKSNLYKKGSFMNYSSVSTFIAHLSALWSRNAVKGHVTSGTQKPSNKD